MKIPVATTTIDADGTETHGTVDMHVITPPIPEGACLECGHAHDPRHPHRLMSLTYQYYFYAIHSRFPRWKDAMAHCTPDMQEYWKVELAARGVDPAFLD